MEHLPICQVQCNEPDYHFQNQCNENSVKNIKGFYVNDRWQKMHHIKQKNTIS